LGVDQQRAFENIKRYLSLSSVIKALMAGILFRLNIVAEDVVIGAVLTQVTEGKEHIITYLNEHLKKLCLSLFYACSKLRHYFLSSTCIVAC
jgi:hypothetical protein